MSKLVYESPFIRKLNVGFTNKFGMRTEFAAVKDIEDIPVSKLIAQYGSPVFVISESKIRTNIHSANRAFKTRYPKVQFAWSYKTNYLDSVCRIFHLEGSWAEVVSGFEYRKALSNNVPGEKIIFNGPDKSEEDIKLAISKNSLIHIDHLDELYKLIEIAGETGIKPRVAVRVNMDVGIYPMWDRFGLNYENGQAWSAINKIVNSGVLNLIGLHCHIGTYILSPNAYAVAATKLCDLARNCKSLLNIKIQYIDMGGGFPSTNTLKGAYLQGIDTVPSIDEFAEAITSSIYSAGFNKDDMPTLILETGRALIDDTAYLLGSVIANKRLSDGRRAIVVDFGVNILFTSFWYDHKISPAQEFSHHSDDVSLYGPLCMNIDCIRESINLPLLNIGDQLVVHKVGAYNMTQWMQFISFRPNVILIDLNGKTHLIRKAETMDSITKQELIPEYLETK
jgi:diaminopimelate decarboxylase